MPRVAPAWRSDRSGVQHLTRRKRPDRLRGRAQFDAVLTGCGGIARGRYFIIRVAPGAQATARLGIIASRKSIRRAVDRNTCKRIAREAFREFAADLAGLDVVVICRTVVAPKERSQARNELNGMLPRLAVHDGAREAPSAARGRAE